MRTRYHGFTMSENEIDRVVADWIDKTPNVALVLKAWIYSAATGSRIVMGRDTETVSDEHVKFGIGEAGAAFLQLDD